MSAAAEGTQATVAREGQTPIVSAEEKAAAVNAAAKEKVIAVSAAADEKAATVNAAAKEKVIAVSAAAKGTHTGSSS